MIKSFQVQKQF